MKVKSCLAVVLFLSILEIKNPNSLVFGNERLSELETLTKRCIHTKKSRECRIALSFAEVLQNRASSGGNFSCQSRLLGLESDLILISLQSVQDEHVFKMLEEVIKFCDRI